MKIAKALADRLFKLIHKNSLIYNCCWEDPRLDRVALDITTTDTILTITSAGCNALDYLLAGAKRVHCVDLNFRQNSLLELKIKSILNLEYHDFFKIFGEGYHPKFKELYREHLRWKLSPTARNFWDKHIHYFLRPKTSFYFRGGAGYVARAIRFYIDHVAKIRKEIDELIAADSLDKQRSIYTEKIQNKFWKPSLLKLLNNTATLSFLGVPPSQVKQLEDKYVGGIKQFIKDSTKRVFCEIPIRDNYFWLVYLTGRYTKQSCPEYLKRENYNKLREILSSSPQRLLIHTDSLVNVLSYLKDEVNKYVLLDHMDWLWENHQQVLREEWQQILNGRSKDRKIIWRSAGLETNFIKTLRVNNRGRYDLPLSSFLEMQEELASTLHKCDRVQTYGSFHIASVVA